MHMHQIHRQKLTQNYAPYCTAAAQIQTLEQGLLGDLTGLQHGKQCRTALDLVYAPALLLAHSSLQFTDAQINVWHGALKTQCHGPACGPVLQLAHSSLQPKGDQQDGPEHT